MALDKTHLMPFVTLQIVKLHIYALANQTYAPMAHMAHMAHNRQNLVATGRARSLEWCPHHRSHQF